MANILITGGAGYIGSKLTKFLLDEGHHVVVFDLLEHGSSSLESFTHHSNFQLIEGDVRDINSLKPHIDKADFIFPLAALVGAPLCDERPDDAVEINQKSIELLLENTSDNHKIIYPTTNSGYGTKSGETYCTEETPLEPISLYGKTKVEAESLIIASKKGITLRLATIFGTSFRTRFDLMVNNFVMEAVKTGKLEIFEGHFKRNFIHIDDVCSCFLFLMKNFSTLKGEVFNLGQDQANMSKLELAQEIKKQLPELVITENEFAKDIDKRNYIVSSDKLRLAGFEAKISLESGIKEMIAMARKVLDSSESFHRNY
ncbi:MAG: NAD(P)-dependent oxidoreductase [Oligoflexia bacterium]|nr:NAD(P)-dependent oxidoreductase [Oligoflexia bacterium]